MHKIILFSLFILLSKNVFGEMIKPDPSIGPKEVISIQLKALQKNNSPFDDAGIEQTHSKLNDVYERQERCEILQNELQANKLKLEKECEKAKIYKKLKQKFSELSELKKVILYQDQIKRIDKIREKGLSLDDKKKELTLNQENLRLIPF